ncbi:MAG: cation diffusion facilitator family transporter [Lachnospiraceae bacterium]|jgi:cation diffusion facilitator family transporter|nr:cation diffusion facilitator family transporter [Lachnospiraceae bacterium]MCI1397410.1 cation diffusion facilitator family transporter [Lachnospiraceae bacterium]MCI1423391.1 cation diffusion facilitator family transporter [Lachnospiraceae bacterium]MCI1452192.1 cation diffusion facilitator family transporter [Lachnospiraceae bacterium]
MEESNNRKNEEKIQTVGTDKEQPRNAVIIRTSVIGIGANVLLAAFKAVIGAATGSIAIVMDAVNNLSDAASSLITIVGTRLAGRQPDKKHPFGYGRIEYLTAVIISVIVLYAGITSLQSSIKGILHPELPNYTAISLVIVAAAVLVKILLGTYVKKTGQKVNSGSLIASGEDARMDAVISASTLAAAAVFLLTHISLEAWLGAVIAVIIIKSGIGLLRDTISQILGQRADGKLVGEIKKTCCTFPNVYGAYDLVLNDYGPDRYLGSIHLEVPDYLTAEELDVLERKVSAKIFQDYGVLLTGISVYARNTRDNEEAKLYQNVRRIVTSHDSVLQMHGFFADLEKKTMRFDMVISFGCKDRAGEYRAILAEVRSAYPDFKVDAVMDADLS